MRDYFDYILLRTNTTKNGGQKSAMMLFIALCLRFLLHVYSDFVHWLALVAAEAISWGGDDFQVLLCDSRLCTQNLEQVCVALGCHLGENLHHVVLVDFGRVFLDVCLEILVAFVHLVDGSVIKFIQFSLVVLLLVEINLELLDLVFPGRLSRVVVLREWRIVRL